MSLQGRGQQWRMIYDRRKPGGEAPNYSRRSHKLRARPTIPQPTKQWRQHGERNEQRGFHRSEFRIRKVQVALHRRSDCRNHLTVYIVEKVDQGKNRQRVIRVSRHRIGRFV